MMEEKDVLIGTITWNIRYLMLITQAYVYVCWKNVTEDIFKMSTYRTCVEQVEDIYFLIFLRHISIE